MARKGILRVLPVGGIILTDKGYVGELSQVITPIDDQSKTFNRHHKIFMDRHEGINKGIKNLKCMSDM